MEKEREGKREKEREGGKKGRVKRERAKREGVR